MGDLMVVQTAGQLCFVEVGSDMLVGHLLLTGLEEVCFLFCC